VLLRLGYLIVSNIFAMLRLLPMRKRGKEVEILALRHQIAVLERQLGKQRVRFTPGRSCLPRGTPALAANAVLAEKLIRPGERACGC
jgi:hypothetical protein